MQSQNSRCSLQGHTAKSTFCPHRAFSSTAHLKKQGTFDFTASLMLSEADTDMNTQKKAAESCFTMKPLHKSLSLFLLAENMSVKAGHRGPEQYWQRQEQEQRQKLGSGLNRSVTGFLVSVLWPWSSASLALCPREVRSAVISENCTFERMP